MKENVKSFLLKYKESDLGKMTDAAVELSILYKSALGKSIDCVTCESKLKVAYRELEQYLNDNYIHTMSENFTLKKGVQIHLHKQHVIITESNLDSDATAIELLKQNKNLIAAFETYPANWEQLIASGKVEKKEQPAHDESANDEAKEKVKTPSKKK